MAVCVRSWPSYCHLNQISISTACDFAAATDLLLSGSHLNFALFIFLPHFPNLPMCVFRLRSVIYSVK